MRITDISILEKRSIISCFLGLWHCLAPTHPKIDCLNFRFQNLSVVSINSFYGNRCMLSSTLGKKWIWHLTHCTDISWTSLVAQMIKNLPAMQETQVWTLGLEDTLEKGMKPIHLLFSSDLSLTHSRPKKSCIFIFCIYFLFASLIGSGLPWWFSSKEFTCKGEDAGDRSLIPGSGRSPGGESGNPLQYFFLESPMDRGGWWATVHRVAKSRTWLSDWA